ncbi:T9SS type A sorting domain-containing protein [Haliscomenobacter sp.]|uniref:T9SS type A sorting domain-containing protein n=1 Tax=Haliscomenobacter sp. TaxID=2717303 RepID=UPI003BABB650
MNYCRFIVSLCLSVSMLGVLQGQTIRKISTGELNIEQAVYLPSQGKLYNAVPDDNFSQYANRLIKVDPAWGKVEKVFKIGFNPTLVTATNDEQYLYITTSGPSRLKLFKVAEEKIEWELPLGALQPTFILPAPQQNKALLLISSSITESWIQFLKDDSIQPEKIVIPSPGYYTKAAFVNDSSIIAWNGFGQIFRIKLRSNGLFLENTFENLPLYLREENIYLDGKLISAKGRIIDVSRAEPLVLEQKLPVSEYAPLIHDDPFSPFFYILESFAGPNQHAYLKFKKSTLELEKRLTVPVPLESPDTYVSEFYATGPDRFMVKNHLFTHIYWACTSELSRPSISASGALARCPDSDTLFLQTALGNASEVVWTTAEKTSRIAATQAGAYGVKLSDTRGCQTALSEPVEVTFHPKPYVLSINSELGRQSPQTICKGKSIRLSGDGFGGNQWRWSSGERTLEIVAKTGDYQVKLISEQGCESDWSPVFSILPGPDSLPVKPVVTLLNRKEVYCVGDTAIVQGPTGYQYYYWNISSENKAVVSTQSSSMAALIVGNDLRCLSERSEPLEIRFNPQPFPPVIRQEGNLIVSSVGTATHEWFVNGNKLNGETGSTLNLKGGGFYSAKVFNNGCSSRISNLISISGKTVSIDEPIATQTLKIYPNPAHDYIRLDFAAEPVYALTVQLFSGDGRKILELSGLRSDPQLNRLAVATLPPGLYVVEALAEDRRFVGRFIKW